MSERINCFHCRHFYITHNPELPRGCRAWQFTSRQMPSAEVKLSSGRDCLLFEPKPGKPSPRA